MITLLIDDHIPFIKGVFEKYARVIYVKGGRMDRTQVMQANGLIIRTRTRCDEKLLDGTPVRFIATATIGYDHIDTGYCERKGISWHYAPGCNAASVRQYVASALASMLLRKKLRFEGQRIGIVGVGHVGSKVADLAKILGMVPLLNDPPRQRLETGEIFVPLEEILKTCDIISLHVPHTMDGPDRTHHLVNEDFLAQLARQPLLINTARGPIVKTDAVKSAVLKGLISGYVADVWENEPDADRGLINLSQIATPHIAGYSQEGKANGTAACVRAAGEFFGWDTASWYPDALPPPENPEIKLETPGKSDEKIIAETILASYDILNDDSPFRQDPGAFEHLRNYYPVRREFEAFSINAPKVSQSVASKLIAIGFK